MISYDLLVDWLAQRTQLRVLTTPILQGGGFYMVRRLRETTLDEMETHMIRVPRVTCRD